MNIPKKETSMFHERIHKSYYWILAIAIILIAREDGWSQANWAVTNTFHVGGEGGMDYVTVAPDTHMLYVTRSTHTLVIDTTSGKSIADIPGQKRSHGVALVPDAGRGFISDGGGNGAIEIFDLKSNAVLGTIPALPDADGILYDKATNRVLVVSGDKGVLMTLAPDVDPKNGKIETPIDLGGAPEFLATDGDGKAYINLEDKDVVAVVDLKQRKVIARWPVAPGGHPVGMSMDTAHHRLFIGCRDPQKLIVMDSLSGKVISDLPIGAGVDATGYGDSQAFASCRDGKLIVAGADAKGGYKVVQTVATPLGAKTMTYDGTTQQIYLPTAEFEPAKPNSRPAAKPGTFMIVVVGQKKE
jgi:DNA-binding beta-propeller fold protein YncE